MQTQNNNPLPVQCLTDDQLDTLLNSVHRFRDRAILTLLADAGLRNAELCHLFVSDLWFLGEPANALEVRAAIAKNHKPRTIPLTPRCTAAIQDLRDSAWLDSVPPNQHYAFHASNPRKPITPRTVQRICAYHGRTILNMSLHPHMLRHTFATRLMRKCPIRVVQQLLGHTSLISTQIYTHPNTQDLQSAIDALNE